MRRKRKNNFRRMMVLNTPKNTELSKLVSDFEIMLNSAKTIVFDREHNWCIIGIQKTYTNHRTMKRMINTIYSSSAFKNERCNMPWLNIVYMSINTKNMTVESVCLLNKCRIIVPASSKYLDRILEEIDPSIYYLRMSYDQAIDLLWDTELTDTIINNFKR